LRTLRLLVTAGSGVSTPNRLTWRFGLHVEPIEEVAEDDVGILLLALRLRLGVLHLRLVGKLLGLRLVLVPLPHGLERDALAHAVGDVLGHLDVRTGKRKLRRRTLRRRRRWRTLRQLRGDLLLDVADVRANWSRGLLLLRGVLELDRAGGHGAML